MKDKLHLIYGQKKDPKSESLLEKSLDNIRHKKESDQRVKQLYQQMQLLKEESERYRRKVRELESEKANLLAQLKQKN